MDWWRRSFRGNADSYQALISEVEVAVTMAPDAAAGWDCRVALACVQHLISNFLGQHGQYDRAIELLERALRIRMATLGEMHADTAATISSMGTSYGDKGQYDRAIELYERALRIKMATLGEMHASTAETISNMGASYNEKGQYDRAIEFHERALRICHAVSDPHHPQTQQTEESLANAKSNAAQQSRAGRGRR